jgi:two-component system, NarL family, nitrate/nitrite response regulator NarL
MLPINVCIISDVRLHCDGLATLLSPWPLINVLGACTPAEAPNVMRTANTDVALLDMPRPSIVKFLEALRITGSRPRIIAIGIRTAGEVLTCAAVGIDGYVGSDAPVGDIVTTIERVARDGVDLASKRAASPAALAESPAALRSTLTSRELQVADLMNLGLANKEIANRLGVEPCTAKNHVRNILNKLGVHRRGTAVAKLHELIAERFGTSVTTSLDPQSVDLKNDL